MTLHFSSDAAIERIGLGLLSCSLPKPEWTHAGHFAAALWLLRARPDLDASREMPGIIRAYNLATGVANTDTGGYHETITQASLHMARRFIAVRPPTEPLHELHAALMTSPLGGKDWLLAYWSAPLLFSVEARRGWVDPDLQALPGWRADADRP
jgi:hypothetical protein